MEREGPSKVGVVACGGGFVSLDASRRIFMGISCVLGLIFDDCGGGPKMVIRELQFSILGRAIEGWLHGTDGSCF